MMTWRDERVGGVTAASFRRSVVVVVVDGGVVAASERQHGVTNILDNDIRVARAARIVLRILSAV